MYASNTKSARCEGVTSIYQDSLYVTAARGNNLQAYVMYCRPVIFTRHHGVIGPEISIVDVVYMDSFRLK